MLIRCAILALGLIVAALSASADQCRTTGLTCLEYDTITVSGVVIEDACIRVQKVEDCTLSDPENSCDQLEPRAQSPSSPLRSGQCRLVEETCSDFAFGECILWERSYECFNAPVTMGQAILEDRAFSNLQETFNNRCSVIESNPDCSFIQSETTEGFGTRNINARDVTRSWWRREHRFDCSTGSFTDTCQDLDAAPICRQTGHSTCIARDSDRRCIAQRERYLCESDTSFSPQCSIVEVCEDGSCDPEEDELSDDYAQAAAWLNFLDNASKNNECDAADPDNFEIETEVDVADCLGGTFEDGHSEPTVFNGQLMYCTTDFFRSCRRNSQLYARIRAGAAHFLRSQCRGIFCTARRHYYCTYNSKFARVFQEQAHLQTGAQFSNDCPGFTITQLEAIDVNAMDLSEVFCDMLNEAEVPVQDLVIDRLSQEMGVFQLDVDDTLGGGN